MDLGKLLISVEPEVMEVLHPVTRESLEHDGRPFVVHLYGKDSPQYSEAVTRHRALFDQDPARYSAKVLADLTAYLSVFRDGAWVEENQVEELFYDFVWLREQADRFIHSRANFMRG